MIPCVDTYFNISDLQGSSYTFPAKGNVRKLSWTPGQVWWAKIFRKLCPLHLLRSSQAEAGSWSHSPMVGSSQGWTCGVFAFMTGMCETTQHHWLAMSRIMTPKWPNFSGSNQPREIIFCGMMLEMFCAKILFFGKIHEGFGTPSHHCFCGTSVEMI
jgi:hypothetical protein